MGSLGALTARSAYESLSKGESIRPLDSRERFCKHARSYSYLDHLSPVHYESRYYGTQLNGPSN